MRLALQTDYALRTLLYLADRGTRVQIRDVAEFFSISQHHVAKVVQQLARLGYIRSLRGIGGGLELARPPEEITVGRVVLDFEGNMHLLECVGTAGVCVIQPRCGLKGVLAEAERRQQQYLDSVRLSDLIEPGVPLVELRVAPPAAANSNETAAATKARGAGRGRSAATPRTAASRKTSPPRGTTLPGKRTPPATKRPRRAADRHR